MKEKGKLKICGIIVPEFGSHYHRIKLSLNSINGKTIKVNDEDLIVEVSYDLHTTEKIELKEELFKNNDIIYYSFLVSNDITELSIWKNRHNTLILTDLDDAYWDKSHLYFSPNWESGIIRSTVLADFTTVTNPYLASKLEPYSQTLAIIPNFLPFGESQFTPKPQPHKQGNKLRIGFIGSFSHIPDLLSFKPILNRLAKNKKIVNNYEFILVADEENKGWKLIIDMFKKKKNINFKVVPPKTVESYMSLYDEVDIVIQPLLVTDHNFGKSGLKIIESSIKDCIFIGSQLYEHKEFPSYFKCEEPLDYDKTLEFLLEDNNYEVYRDKLCKENLELNKWQQRVDFIQELITLVCNKKEEESNVKIWGITYDKVQSTEYIPYFNQTKDKSSRFEYNPIIDIIDNKVGNFTGYVGVFSWKFPYKTGLYKKILYGLVDKYADNADVLSFCQPYFKNNYLKFSYEQHPKLQEILQKVCDKLGMELPKEVDKVVYSNFFLAKANIYKKYVDEIVIPAIDYMENEIWDEVNIDANYISGLQTDKLKEYTGLEFYNYVTFVCERLLSIWLYNNPSITFKQMI